MDNTEDVVNGISISFGRLTIRFSGEADGRPFVYFRGASVLTRGTVDTGDFKVVSIHQHKELIKNCEHALQDSRTYASLRESKTQMFREATSLHAGGLQGKNKAATGGGKKTRKRK